MRVIALTLIAQLVSCNFAIKHPAVTAAIVGGGVALGTCELEGASQKDCAIVSGSVALGLGIIAGIAMWMSHEEIVEEPEAPPLPPRKRHAPLPDIVPTPQPTPQPQPQPQPEPQPEPQPQP
jgi:outer membrane biosynthesis protein TonB